MAELNEWWPVTLRAGALPMPGDPPCFARSSGDMRFSRA